MKIHQLLCGIILTLITVFTAFGQSGLYSGINAPKGIIYNKEGNFSALIHPNGWSFGYQNGRIRTYYKTTHWNFEFGEIRHPKEYRQKNEYYIQQVQGSTGSPRSFSYGKQNSLFVTRIGWGKNKFLTDKAIIKGVAIGFTYEIGANIGIIKPYYLELIDRLSDPPTIVSKKYSEEIKSEFLDYATIYGSSPFTKGLKELSIVPGGYARFALHLDWGAFDEFAKAVDAGVMIDFYPKAIPIMISEENKPIFINLYLRVLFGKRW